MRKGIAKAGVPSFAGKLLQVCLSWTEPALSQGPSLLVTQVAKAQVVLLYA